MKRNVTELLLQMERRCGGLVTAPADPVNLERLRRAALTAWRAMAGLYEVSDGVDAPNPGFVFYPVSKVLAQAYSPGSPGTTVGAFNFGDELIITADGQLAQLDHETGEIFLTWESPEDFLEEELHILEEEVSV
ncbi:MAG: hypothetical protein IKR61_04550 [Lachnospiraceae bacterium]|nr:hypothetical protein [Lachnospiraceae bacterium]